MNSLLEDLLWISSQRNVDFFVENLREVVSEKKGVKDDETVYVASTLAHFAETSRFSTSSVAPPMNDLSEVFEHVVWRGGGLVHDAHVLAVEASQILFLAGFFRNHMRRRHILDAYDQIGQSLYYTLNYETPFPLLSPHTTNTYSAH
jgi:hypothetical protein